MKNKLIPIVFSAALLAGSVVSISSAKQEVSAVQAYEEMTVSNGGDGFVLMDKSYASNESFVYTGELYYNEGTQAGGLVFGGIENEHYYVLTMDRFSNHIKLIDFRIGQSVTELYVCDFIGNSKNVKPEEWSFINPKVKTISNINLKVVVTVEDSHAYAEFYVEGIRRFFNDDGSYTTIDLNKDGNYVGGQLGLNVFNGTVTLKDVQAGKSDYSYFTEAYRNQYHLQPFAKWTNDPNALVYYNGWYHVFYQTNPFGLYWDAMFWGHARSRDLIHFEYLPICLFPSNNDDGSTSYMWSGCAVAYYQGMSSLIDERHYFSSGSGLLAIFTEDRCGGYAEAQNQIVITSDDEGLTWEKRDVIYQRERTPYYDTKIDWRDPKIFPAAKDEQGKVTTWGMTLSSYALNKGWLMQSTDLINWHYTQQFALPTPECIGLGVLEDENGVEHAYLTNKSRTYLFGSIGFYNNELRFVDEEGVNISQYTLEEMKERLLPLDFGPDSYASQSFYITDPTSEYCGKDIVLNWFSGDLNASYCTGPGEYANLRGRWNGGFTTPVEYGIANTEEGMRLTQKPITVDNEHLAKTKVVELENVEINSTSENVLKDVHTHIFELSASITTNDDSPITFKVDVGDGEYMQLGWNKTDGYYVDRTYLDDKGINTNVDWHVKYASHLLGDSDTKTFYVLSDNGGLEVFCEDYSIPFYFVTTAAVGSTGASLSSDSAIINYLCLSEVKSAYQKEAAQGEGVLYVSSHDVSLDTSLSTSKFVSCWYTGQANLKWEEVSNEGVVTYTTSNQGINLIAVKGGSASFKVSADDKEEVITVTVSDAVFESDFTFKKENIISGSWTIASNSLIGEKPAGNGFILAEETGSDFTYNGRFDIVSGTAGALVFRAASDMSSYLVANYDAGERVVKLWSTHGELTRSGHVDVNVNNVALTIKATGRNIKISINGDEVIDYTLLENEPLTGRFGVNVFSSTVAFKSLNLIEDEQDYEYTSGELEIDLGIAQYVSEVYNLTAGNTRLEPGYYRQSVDSLFIEEEYFALLENGNYKFKVVGSLSTINVTVKVTMSRAFVINDVTTEVGLDVSVYVGNHEINKVEINGEQLDSSKYYVHDYVLTIDSECFKEGENTVVVNSTTSFKVTVRNNSEVVPIPSSGGCGGNIATTSILLSSLSLFSALLVIISVKRKKRDTL